MKSFLPRLLLLLVALIAINWLASFVSLRWDLTEDKRYTVSDATKRLLEGLDKDVNVTVYLAGDFPPGFERLETATRETLEEFKTYADGHLTYRFIDPSVASTEEKRGQQYQQLVEAGLTPTNLFDNEGGKRTEKLVFPGAIVEADTLAVPVQLLKGNKSASSEEQLNQSYEGVEFQIASAIRQLIPTERRRVGLVVSHTSASPAGFSDLIATMQQKYDVFLDVNNPASYDGLDALLVLKPDQRFSDEEKYMFDQYVVNGGKALFFVDGAKVDSISLEGTFAQPLDLNLGDLFFKWGVRLNANLVKDMNSAAILLNVGNLGDQPQLKPLPWRFFPLLNNFGNSPITRNIDAIYTRYLSSLDTVGGAAGIRRTPLLMTSPYTKTLNAPVLVAYNEARQQPEANEYQGGAKLAAVLLEGSFVSLFQNRILPEDPRRATFKESGTAGKVMLCADGDVVINDFDFRRNTPFPLGFDRVTNNVFGNKDFVLHALDYMLDPDGLITARTKQISIRPLDKIRLQDERTQWQLFNLLLPLGLIGLFGATRYGLRRHKFARQG
ncbi:gliding motility-associated ABC transporter substrate-binding protein GldG [Persicitalea jodogahamensis]|uniref:Gliding motility-associated ABC transporter substrate-binding protein GldG n=1 Tax=Persicitalea jodogahamensis TaxID=402147 RepID=A0A8J3D8T2_9BACT|nr:gliding motility-associated ABC transporter substrate-binding protein GldG [Persicitalea jodogahamensis]GHB88655.1 gliding motility-associated ABC transporter substrate-binding protein GldG [Persicitalea jodogahamensis]